MIPCKQSPRIEQLGSVTGISKILKQDFLMVLLLLLVSCYLYSHWIWRPTSPDERAYLAWGMRIYKEGVYETLNGSPVTKVPPLHSHLIALGFRLFGPSVDAAQGMSLLFGCLSIGLAYLFGRCLWNRRVGVMAAFLLLTSAKGTFWLYSNRVLNEIHLSFFLLLSLFFLCLYVRSGRLWTACGIGISLGLGMLTKEFIIVILPVVLAGIFLRADSISRKVGVGLGVLGIALLILLPWLIHIDQVTGSPLGGITQRAKGHAVDALTSEKAWGIRSLPVLIAMLRFFDRPAWFSQVIGWMAVGFAIWTAIGAKRKHEVILVAMLLIWFGTFAFFKALPLDLRRLVPLLPIFAILTAVFFDAVWGWVAERADKLRISRRSLAGFFAGVLVLFLVNDLKPSRTLRGFQTLCVFCSPRTPYLEEEVRAALQCLPKGARVATNYKSLLYFYSGGDLFPSGIPLTLEKKVRPWMKEAPKPHRALVSPSIIYDFYHKGRRMVMDEATWLRRLRESQVEFLVFFQSGNPRWAPRQLGDYFRQHPERYRPICQTERVQVYRIVDISPSPADPDS